jgi:lipopolysaccharide transport system ATP-binding protein
MNDIVIDVSKVSKVYHLGDISSRNLQEDFARWWAKIRGKSDPLLKIGQEHVCRSEGQMFWALRDINFQVKRGEVLGLVGGNGAGKSTLLKILSQITAPTEGEIRLQGRVASLLEVGTGFNPELTGRENIYLNGTILGMSKAEIKEKLAEIIDFSGVEQFIDTPVKRYSSGMYVRLAFAIAAHLDPEILIIDEVLAVGDAAFQAKSLAKLQEVSNSGRTILFVSHNLSLVKSLCTRAILLSDGGLVQDGSPEEIIHSYTSIRKSQEEQLRRLPDDPNVEIKRVLVHQGQGNTSQLDASEAIQVDVEYAVKQQTHDFRIYVDVCDENMDTLFRSFHDELEESPSALEAGIYRATATIPGGLLAGHDYYFRIRTTIHNVRQCAGAGITVPVNVAQNPLYNRAYPDSRGSFKIQPPIKWSNQMV